MSAVEHSHPTDDYAAVSLKRRHDSQYWIDPENEWLPRRASFELQVGPALGFTRVWREICVEVESGPAYLYRYFPFVSYFYVGGRAQTVLEFDQAHQPRQAVIRVPVGIPVQMTVVTELAGAPAAGGHGEDDRELALRFLGLSLGEGLAEPPPFAAERPREHYEMNARSIEETSPAPIFVIGSYRSGTSVLTWALGQHPNIWPLEETGWIPPLADAAILGYRSAKTAPRSFFDVYDVERREYYTQIGYAIDRFCRNASRRRLHGVLLGRLSGQDEEHTEEYQIARSVMNPKRRWVDGTPENCRYVTVLRSIFPFARFIALVRNPLDVVASMLRFERAGGTSYGVSDAAGMWLEHMRAALLSYRALGPGAVRLVSYEALCSDTPAALRSLLDFLDEPTYPKGAETFSKRINSSQISAEERAQLYGEIDAEPKLKRELLALYAEIADAMKSPWEPDAAAAEQLVDIENDRIMRLALEYRGGVPLPSE